MVKKEILRAGPETITKGDEVAEPSLGVFIDMRGPSMSRRASKSPYNKTTRTTRTTASRFIALLFELLELYLSVSPVLHAAWRHRRGPRPRAPQAGPQAAPRARSQCAACAAGNSLRPCPPL